jgi:hypothetical protein
LYGARLLTVNGTTNGIEFHILSASTSTAVPSAFQFCDAGAARINFVVSGLNIPVGQWNHVAASKNGTNWAIWLNGARVGTTTVSAVFAAGALLIGGSPASTNYLEWFPGYISNLRIVKAVVYDPTLTTITVPTSALTAIPNTYLLTCQSSTFVDNSSNNFSITNTGSIISNYPNPFSNSPVLTYSYNLTVPTSTISNLTSANTWAAQVWDPEYIPQSLVRTKLKPTNASENLYYATLVKGKYGVADDLNQLQLDNTKAVFYSPTSGLVTKSKFSKDGAGLADPSARSKEPVQFWN